MARDYSNLFPTDKTPKKERILSPLETLGWQPFFAQQVSTDALTQTPPVRVTEVHRNAMHILGDQIDQKIPYHAGATVGDWLLLDQSNPQDSLVLDRKSLVKRRAAGLEAQVQLIAANIETMFIVSSCNPDFNIARLERYVALALDAEITPVILLTKSDIVDDEAEAENYKQQAQSISADIAIITLDARGDEPKAKLAPWCTRGQTIAFLGSSGVGKSTLTNALIGEKSIATKAIREDDAKGRHTTTSRQLHRTGDGFLVLDTPGMRELQLTDVASGIEDLFSDFQDLTTKCKFNDCSHETEPGCAIQKAINAGQIDMDRLARWRKLMAEEAFNTATIAERRSKDKTFGKMVKSAMKHKKNKR